MTTMPSMFRLPTRNSKIWLTLDTRQTRRRRRKKSRPLAAPAAAAAAAAPHDGEPVGMFTRARAKRTRQLSDFLSPATSRKLVVLRLEDRNYQIRLCSVLEALLQKMLHIDRGRYANLLLVRVYE